MFLNRNFNNVVGVAGLLALTLSASIALAEVKETMKIKVSTDDGVSETVTIENLAVGESEVFVTESGQEVFVTRLEDMLQLELGDRVIDVRLPDIKAHGDHGVEHIFLSDHDSLHEGADNVWIAGDDDIRVVTSSSKKVVIKTDEDMTAEELEALIGAHAAEVEVLMEGDGLEEHDVIVIKKQITIDEEELD
ncbi:MAG: hypothetical protein AAGA23_11415 [Pseudomonadota bacterium]